jgi:hypothetical protein
VGESHRNPDGTSRQQLIRTRTRAGLMVQLVPEPENPYDDHAVKVCLETGEQLGYLSSDDAAELAEQRQAGWRHTAIVHRVLGGTRDKPSRGVLLRLVSAPPGTTDAEIHAALEDARIAPDPWDSARRPASRPDAAPPRTAITLELPDPQPAQAGGLEEDAVTRRRPPWTIIVGVSLGLAAALYLLAR